jgi:uncharacterized protein YkwD
MFRPLITVISLCVALESLATGAAAPKPAAAGDRAPKSSWQQVAPQDALSSTADSYDTQAERHLLDLANAERARVGSPQLKMDEGLARAARAHAAQMASQNQLSHQFSGEASLTQRIAAVSTLHLNRAGENVAVAPNAANAHQGLMSSPPHRDNLLSAQFNVAGIGVFRRGHLLYVAQDFGSSTPSYSVQQAQELVSTSVEQLRIQANLPRLQRVDSRSAQSSACAMAKDDSLNAATPPAGAYMLRYTTMQPETLPSAISKVIAQRGLRTYSAGSCYARTGKYPNGAYWVVLVFY